jgi:hypothetical protein
MPGAEFGETAVEIQIREGYLKRNKTNLEKT